MERDKIVEAMARWRARESSHDYARPPIFVPPALLRRAIEEGAIKEGDPRFVAVQPMPLPAAPQGSG